MYARKGQPKRRGRYPGERIGVHQWTAFYRVAFAELRSVRQACFAAHIAKGTGLAMHAYIRQQLGAGAAYPPQLVAARLACGKVAA